MLSDSQTSYNRGRDFASQEALVRAQLSAGKEVPEQFRGLAALVGPTAPVYNFNRFVAANYDVFVRYAGRYKTLPREDLANEALTIALEMAQRQDGGGLIGAPQKEVFGKIYGLIDEVAASYRSNRSLSPRGSDISQMVIANPSKNDLEETRNGGHNLWNVMLVLYIWHLNEDDRRALDEKYSTFPEYVTSPKETQMNDRKGVSINLPKAVEAEGKLMKGLAEGFGMPVSFFEGRVEFYQMVQDLVRATEVTKQVGTHYFPQMGEFDLSEFSTWTGMHENRAGLRERRESRDGHDNSKPQRYHPHSSDWGKTWTTWLARRLSPEKRAEQIGDAWQDYLSSQKGPRQD